MAVVELKGQINQEQFVELETCVWKRTSTTDDGQSSQPVFIVGDGHLAVIGGSPPCPVLVFIGAAPEDHSGLKSLSSRGAAVCRLRVVHKWSCEQLDKDLGVLMRLWC